MKKSCLNPFRAGRCLSTYFTFIIAKNVLSQSLFRAGRCLSTKKERELQVLKNVSIPFEQGDVFRRFRMFGLNTAVRRSQSLSSRAMSFDLHISAIFKCNSCVSIPFEQGDVFRLNAPVKTVQQIGLNPFRAGRCLSTAAVCWRQESCGLSDPLPNFFGRLRSWLLI